MLRVLNPGGKALVTVWAKEQKYKDKESFYISKKNAGKSCNENSKKILKQQKIKIPESTAKHESNPLCHKFGKEFQKQDLFVAWHYSNSATKKSKNEIIVQEEFNATKSQSVDSDAKEQEKVFLRFYHVFENKELEELLNQIPNIRVVDSFYEQGNWCAVFEKI